MDQMINQIIYLFVLSMSSQNNTNKKLFQEEKNEKIENNKQKYK